MVAYIPEAPAPSTQTSQVMERSPWLVFVDPVAGGGDPDEAAPPQAANGVAATNFIIVRRLNRFMHPSLDDLDKQTSLAAIEHKSTGGPRGGRCTKIS
jgi:hypothetical protein